VTQGQVKFGDQAAGAEAGGLFAPGDHALR
jgi:hypothetical protein